MAAISDEIPYVKADLSGSYYVDVVSQDEVSGVKALDRVLVWIELFEKWVNEEIEVDEFVVDTNKE